MKDSKSLSWTGRFLFGMVAIAGTVIYAASFALIEESAKLVPVARAIGIASGVSWPVFGVILLLVTRCRPRVLAWADACLITMIAGITVLMLSALSNVAAFVIKAIESAGASTTIHTAILIAADLLMAVVFVRHARMLGLGRALAVTLWVVALNGIFAALLILLSRSGDFAL
ncbi:MAG: hypothetical protein L0229_08700 [Blastocatellia bacterium]|nr:hypothetical protein [Blastocatellia bacterium]